MNIYQFIIPAKKQPSSPKRGLKDEHLGEEYSAINVQMLSPLLQLLFQLLFTLNVFIPCHI